VNELLDTASVAVYVGRDVEDEGVCVSLLSGCVWEASGCEAVRVPNVTTKVKEKRFLFVVC
jgi:hypothetical protein